MASLNVIEKIETPARSTASTLRMEDGGLQHSSHPGRSALLRSPGLWLTIGTSAFVFFCLFLFPNLPIWTGTDQVFFLEDAKRMLHGETLYRDFFQMTFPATQLYFLSLFKLFGPRTWIPNFTLALLGLAITLLTFRLSTKVLPQGFVALPSLLWLTLIFHEKFDATHHWFSILAVLSALLVLMDGRSPRRIFAAGSLCGLATCFSQSHGAPALLAFGLFVYLEKNAAPDSSHFFIKKFALLLAGFSWPLILIVGPFLLQAGWGRFTYCTFIFLFKYYHAFQVGNDWRSYMINLVPLAHSLRVWKLGAFLLVHAIVPLIYILFLVRYARGEFCQDTAQRSRLLLCSLLGLFLFFGIASTPTWSRLYYVSIPAIILFVWWFSAAGKAGSRALTALYAVTLLLMIGLPIATQIRPRNVLDLSSGRTAILDPQRFERYQWVAAHTHPGDYFFGGFYPDFYFLLGLNNPATVPFVTPDDYTRPEDVADVIAGLEAHRVQFVVWADSSDLPPIPATSHLAPLRAYLHQHYRLAHRFSDYEAWARID